MPTALCIVASQVYVLTQHIRMCADCATDVRCEHGHDMACPEWLLSLGRKQKKRTKLIINLSIYNSYI